MDVDLLLFYSEKNGKWIVEKIFRLLIWSFSFYWIYWRRWERKKAWTDIERKQIDLFVIRKRQKKNPKNDECIFVGSLSFSRNCKDETIKLILFFTVESKACVKLSYKSRKK